VKNLGLWISDCGFENPLPMTLIENTSENSEIRIPKFLLTPVGFAAPAHARCAFIASGKSFKQQHGWTNALNGKLPRSGQRCQALFNASAGSAAFSGNSVR
jgi:hypothetical protein